MPSSSPCGRQFPGSRDESLARYPPPYELTTYVGNFAPYLDIMRFSRLSNIGAALVIPYESDVRDTAVSAWRKLWRYWSDRGASGLWAVCFKMDRFFVRCRKEDEIQRRLTCLQANVRRRPVVQTTIANHLLVLPEDLRRLYMIVKRVYWTP